jgi:hypothetical protein
VKEGQMKRAAYIGTLVVMSVISYFIYERFFSASALGDNVFRAIEKHRLYFAQTMRGPLLVDLDHITTRRVTEHLLIEGGANPTWDDILTFETRMFEIPSSIREFQFLSSSSRIDSFFTLVNLDESTYDDFQKSQYQSYQEYVENAIRRYSKEQSYRFDPLTKQVTYRMRPETEVRLEYKVETPHQDYFAQLVFVDDHFGARKLALMSLSTK